MKDFPPLLRKAFCARHPDSAAASLAFFAVTLVEIGLPICLVLLIFRKTRCWGNAGIHSHSPSGQDSTQIRTLPVPRVACVPEWFSANLQREMMRKGSQLAARVR